MAPKNKPKFEDFIENNITTTVTTPILERWTSRFEGNGWHNEGAQGADKYLEKYGKKIGLDKLIQLACCAGNHEKQEVANRLWEHAYALYTSGSIMELYTNISELEVDLIKVVMELAAKHPENITHFDVVSVLFKKTPQYKLSTSELHTKIRKAIQISYNKLSKTYMLYHELDGSVRLGLIEKNSESLREKPIAIPFILRFERKPKPTQVK